MSAAKANVKPNILFVFSDQQRYRTMGCTGNSVIRTPAFDRLAGEGVLFRQAFSSCPICSPYRAQVLTGRYAHKNGVVCNEYALCEDQTTLPQALKAAGYRTAFFGKWHLGYGPYTPEKRYGFDYMAANNCDHNHDAVHYHANEACPPFIPGLNASMIAADDCADSGNTNGLLLINTTTMGVPVSATAASNGF